MIRQQYHNDLKKLEEAISEMGNLSINAIEESIHALKDLDLEKADAVIKNDARIDELDETVNKLCIHLLALQQPMARDLREIIASLKIIIDLERMSDLAVDIAKIAKRIKGEHIKPLVTIPNMSQLAQEMVSGAMEAYRKRDATLAIEVAKKDDAVDKLFYATWKELIEIMIEDPSKINNASNLLFVLRYLERIGDHASNICESVVYMVTGERVELN